MDTDQIRSWRDEYYATYDEGLREIEKELNEALPEQGYITQEQLEKVVLWKLDAQPGRRDRVVNRVNTVPDEYIQRVSEAALIVTDPKVQLDTLTSIPGIGSATATVILAFFDPTKYAVGDRYVLDALLGEDRQLRISDYPLLLEELRKRNPGDFDLRTVEIAYYQQYRDEHQIGRW